MSTPQKLQTDEEEVLAANRAFYEALRTLDMSLMAQAWLHADWVTCLHPGWDLLVGWGEVRKSWEEIFRSTDQMMVSVSRALVHVAGDVAWITCREDVTAAHQNEFDSALVEASNIFQRYQGRWLMVLHHTAPLAQPPPGGSTPVQ